MGRLTTGLSILLFVLVCGFVIALANADSIEEFTSEACATGNATACAEESQGQDDFLDTLRSINNFNFGEDAPFALNVIWISVLGLLIVAAILLIVFSFIPFTTE